MDQRFPICRIMWIALVASVGIGVVVGLGLPSFGDPFDTRAIRAAICFCTGIISLSLGIRVVLHFASPPRVRFIRLIAAFLMSTIVLFGGGIWIAVPISRLEAIYAKTHVALEFQDATLTSVVVIVFGFPSLLYLVYCFPSNVE